MRTKILLTALALATSIGLVGSVVDPASADSGSDELTLAALVNAERASAGLPALEVRGELFDSGRAWSARMADAGDLAHDARYFRAGRPARARLVAENVAVNGDVHAAHQRLMASAAHRTNILDPRVNALGVGIVERDGQVWITQRFAAIDHSDPAPKVAKAKGKGKGKPKAKRVKTRRARR